MGGRGNCGRTYLRLALMGISVLLVLPLACGESEPPPSPPPPPPTITVSPPSITFIAEQTGGNPVAQVLTVSTSGHSLADHAVSAHAKWLTVEQTSSSSTTLTFRVSALASEQDIGRYTGTIVVSVPDASNSPVTVPVELTISPHVEEHRELLQLEPFEREALEFTYDKERVLFDLENHEEIHISWQATGQRAKVYAMLEAPDGMVYEGVRGRVGGPIDSFTPSSCNTIVWTGLRWVPPCAFDHSGGDACDRADVTLYCSYAYDRLGQKKLLPPGHYVLTLEVFAEAPWYYDFEYSSRVCVDFRYRIESVSG